MKSIIRIILAVLMPLLLASCNKTPVPPMVFGANAWPGYEPAYLARELGYFSADNLRLAEYADAAAVKQALLKHELHMAAVTLSDALQLRRDIPDLKIVLLLDSSTGGDSIPAQDGSHVPGKMLNVLVTRDDDMGRYHNEMVQWARGWQRALEYIRTQPDKAAQIMAQHEHMDVAQFGKAMHGIELLGMQRNRDLLLGEQPAVGGDVEAVQRFLLERGLINMGADTSTLLDTTLLSGAAQ